MISKRKPGRPKKSERQYIDYTQAAKLLGCHIGTIKRYVRKGVLHPKRDPSDHRIALLDETEVRALVVARPSLHARNPGEIAAAVFQCFEEDLTLAEIVVKCKVMPDEVRAFYREYAGDSLEQGFEKEKRAERAASAARQRRTDQKREESELTAMGRAAKTSKIIAQGIEGMKTALHEDLVPGAAGSNGAGGPSIDEDEGEDDGGDGGDGSAGDADV